MRVSLKHIFGLKSSVLNSALKSKTTVIVSVLIILIISFFYYTLYRSQAEGMVVQLDDDDVVDLRAYVDQMDTVLHGEEDGLNSNDKLENISNIVSKMKSSMSGLNTKIGMMIESRKDDAVKESEFAEENDDAQEVEDNVLSGDDFKIDVSETDALMQSFVDQVDDTVDK